MSDWNVTPYPTMEFTTNIAKKGCVVDCAFCPQRTLEKSYQDDIRILTLDNFKRALDKLPPEVRVTFAGFTEPFLNKHCTDMIEYAASQGRRIGVFTTGVGIKPEDVYRLKDIQYDDGPNASFCLHLPDEERIAKHPLNKTFMKTMEAFAEYRNHFNSFYTMCMGLQIHHSITHLFDWASVPNFWNRAGNLSRELIVKPELQKVWNRVLISPNRTRAQTCGCVEKLYHNVMLPNGDVSLCCMDYGLEYILGNLFEQEYAEIMPPDQACFTMCQRCENGVDPTTEHVIKWVEKGKYQ